jgi:hypothetical protein
MYGVPTTVRHSVIRDKNAKVWTFFHRLSSEYVVKKGKAGQVVVDSHSPTCVCCVWVISMRTQKGP